jgi:hypothetical protein
LYAISELLHQLKFEALFQEVFGDLRKVRKSKPVENLALLIATILCGGERLYDIERTAEDPVLPELFGNGQVPQDTSIRDDLQKIGARDEARQELLFRLNELLFHHLQMQIITLDLDGSAISVDGHQEKAEKGYCPEDPGSRCFQSLSANCAETDTTVMEQTRPGSTHCANGFLEFVQALLDRLSPQMKKIVVRVDAGPFSFQLVRLLESYDNVIYELAVPQKGALKRKIRALDYQTYHGSKREYASFGNAKRRYYVERSLRETASQLDLLEDDRYNFRVVVSNDLHRQPHTLFDHYNKRGDDEKNFAELKNEYALGKMVSGDFQVTKALFWVSYLAFTIIGIFRKVALRLEYAHYRLRRLRYLLFNTIAYFVNHARQRILNLARPKMGEQRFKFILRRTWSL